MKILKFTKMDGAGNDFVVLDGIRQKVALTTEQISSLSDRRRGIGFDQLLVVDPPKSVDADFFYRIYNADGSEAEQCGNGARCLFLFIKNQSLSTKEQIVVETQNSRMQLHQSKHDQVMVDMGIPDFSPQEIPIKDNIQKTRYELNLGDETVEVGVVSMGNPHAVQLVEAVSKAPVTLQGPQIENHPFFPKGCNAGYMERTGNNDISLRVWERGAGETLSCGSGACAAASVAILWNIVKSPVKVITKGGELIIAWDGPKKNLQLTGPARQVFEGEILI